ncbi:MAG: glycoside hydrolase family 3 C-terminal domain-containing protein [Prevotella sp.]|jgi:beta-glucosidase|nr:glycoside hydrolase family 3 C-terminal domain-containing protein [Prevotella sp.]MCI1282324.1 glycoside hydrolase family 3 C-terminal domain-containing protein [Prevotella sp.]
MILALLAMLTMGSMAQKNLPYKNPKLPIEQRVKDLLSRMTLEEKVGQMRCTLAWNYYEIQGNKVVPSELFKKDIKEGNIGMLWATYRADPWTQKSLSNGLNPELAAKAGNALQKYVIDNTRLGIPLFLAEEAPHGHMAIGTTVFPTGLGMAATWSPETAEAMGRVVSKEVRLQGAHISYGPVLDLSRDPRWSRVEESMGEDPVLTGTIAAALVKGLGGGDLSKPYSTLVTLKHFIAYGTTEGGQNGNQSIVGQRDLLQNFLPPFKKVIDAGALSVMTSYNSLDGIPSTGSAELYTDILRKQWNFKGFVVSDLYSIDGLWETHHVAKTRQEAGVMALKAGVDEDLGGKAFEGLVDAVKKGMVSEQEIDVACGRILQKKFEMGLFDHPYVDVKAAKEVRSEADKAVALEAAQKLVTLLKNDHNTLPLRKDMKVAVIGPNADNVYNMLGDYTAPQEPGNVKTILMGIQSKLPKENVEYVKGCAVRDTNNCNINEAVEAAKRADVVVVAVGGSSARDFKTSYKATGAAEADIKSISDMDSGEGYDRASLSLLGRQQELLEALKKTGKPLVVIYIEGRPLEKNWAAANADALLTAYYPGQEGGQAIADVLFGDVNPAGRLPISVPVSVGQLPDYYNKRVPKPHNYVEMSAQPLYTFGYGLSYTTFSYSNLQIQKQGKDSFCVSFDVTNTGSKDGDEVAQLYLHDAVASVVQPMEQLKHFARVYIKKGETRHIEFDVTPEDLQMIGQDMKPTIEPGDFEVLVGNSSDNILLKGTLTVE